MMEQGCLMERVSMAQVIKETKSKDEEEGQVANWGEKKDNSCQNDKATKSRVRKELAVGRIEDDLQKWWNNSQKIARVE